MIDHDKLLALAAKARELQRKNYGYGMDLHMDMIDWADEYDRALAQPAEAHQLDAAFVAANSPSERVSPERADAMIRRMRERQQPAEAAQDADGARDAVTRLQAFKDYVHQRLDDAGIPADPPSSHRDAGCRIGGRLDIALATHDAAQGAVADDVVSRAAAAYLNNGLGGWSCSHSAMRDAIAATGLAGKTYEALDEICRALAIIGPVGQIDGYDVIRRDSVIEVSHQRRDTHPQAAPAQGDGDAPANSDCTEPDRASCPRKCSAFCNAAEESREDLGGAFVVVEVGERLFEFRSKGDWINHASRIWRFHRVSADDTLSLDRLGRPVNCGKHFIAAERDDAYPITVYRLRADMNPAASPSPEVGLTDQGRAGEGKQ